MTDVIGAEARKNCDRPHVAQKPEAILSTHLTKASISSGNREATPIASEGTYTENIEWTTAVRDRGSDRAARQCSHQQFAEEGQAEALVLPEADLRREARLLSLPTQKLSAADGLSRGSKSGMVT
jgi:hypothetical protein